MSKFWAVGLLALLAFGPACRPRILPPKNGVQTGVASWYGGEFHGRPTSTGEIYDMNDLTAAHRTLRFGTLVEVTNLLNGKTATVRINDRGPFIGGRVIDLSYAAARLIDLIGPGTAPVRLEIVREPAPLPGASRYSLQVGAYAVKENAERLAAELRPEFPDVMILMFQTEERIYYRVRIPAESLEEARDLAGRLSRMGRDVILLEGR